MAEGRDERLLSDDEVLRIAAVHYPHHCNGLSWCGSCLQDWPCHTIRFVRDRAALVEQIAAAEGRAQDVQISDTQRALEVLYQIHQDNGRGYCDICSERHPCSTIMEVDDLATENARLRAALERIMGTPWKSTEAAIVEIREYARAVLGRVDGEGSHDQS